MEYKESKKVLQELESNEMSNIINKVVCIDWQHGIKCIPNNFIDLVLTDPPYGIEYRSNRRKEKHKSMCNDNDLVWLPYWCNEVKRVCKADAHLYIFCSWHNIDVFKKTLSGHFNVKNILIWEKNNHGAGDLLGDYAPKYEIIIFCSNGQKKLNPPRCTNVIKCAKVCTNNHPTEKPIELLKLLIQKSTKEGDMVLDTFAGSFSTAHACKALKRNFICFEIDPDYCRIGLKRLNSVCLSLFNNYN